MMLKSKSRMAFLIICGSIFLLVSCYKDKTVIEEAAEVTRTVSFSKDIVPIFNKSCNTSGCHSAGGLKPDLSANNAYNVLTSGSYYSKSKPSSSFLYQKMLGNKGAVMPISGSNSEYNALILAWIKQGANNN